MSKSAMLRTRRRDVNVKPNRRLDRKSSRGMIYENEELRLRTININAEIERGQSDIKKLRRENEQLRKEIWCLRDEYEKLDKLLKDKDDETSTYSSESDSCTSCSESDEENEQSQNMENVQKTTLNNLRTEFDHLSVVTEETSAENSDKNSSSAVSPKEVWNIIAPDQGYPNTLSSSRSTLPIDQIPKHFFAPLKTSKSYENCTATENLGISSWSLGSNTQWPPFPNTNFDQPNPVNGFQVKPLINNTGYVPYMAEVARKSSLEACKKTSTDILVKTDSCQPYSKHSSSASFTNGGNLEELLQDIETISQDILQISAQDAQKTNGFIEQVSGDTGRPYKSEMSVVLMPKAMPLIGFDKYQHLNSSLESLEKSFENLNVEKAKLNIGNIHTTNENVSPTGNLEDYDLINNEIYPLSRSKPHEQITRIIENPNELITSRPQVQHLNAIFRNPTETIPNLTLPRTVPNPNDNISQNEALLLTRFAPNPIDPTTKHDTQTIKTPNEVPPRPKTPKFPNELLSFTPNPSIDPNEPDLQRQSNPFFYGTFGNYSDQFSNRYNPELFAHDNFGFKNEVLQQSSNKLDESDHEKMNLKTNLDNETAEKNSTQVKDTKTETGDEKNSKKEEQKSPKSRRTRKMSIYFKGKKDKLARSLSLDTKISQKNLETLFDKSPKIEVSSKTAIDSGTQSQKFDSKLQESDTKTSSDSKTSIDRKHRKSSSTSPERKHVHVKLDDEKMKKGHKKRHRKSDKRPNSNRTNSIDRGGRERSFSVCTDRSNILDHKFGHFDEYTNSERDRSNSLSSCDTVKSRKMSAVPQFQVSGKIPWFGCWGNGCL